MYTEASISLKTDFYCRYGETEGRLYFERTGVPCVIMDSGSYFLAFAMGCGVRAYGRDYGDVVKIMNARSNVCDVHFTGGGSGAQILYKEDLSGIPGIKATVDYTVNKLLRKMHRGRELPGRTDIVGICDRYGSGGWCAYASRGSIRRVPLPLEDNNVILIRTGKRRLKGDGDGTRFFETSETRRITAAAEALGKCRTDVLFDMINESERAIEAMLSPSKEAALAVSILNGLDGVLASRICSCGIVSFTEKYRTDSVIHSFGYEYERETGAPAGIVVVK